MDQAGNIYEYTVEQVGGADTSVADKRAARLKDLLSSPGCDASSATHSQQWLEAPVGPAGTVRLVVMAEIMAAADFKRDNLYIEYAIKYSPSWWSLIHPPPESPSPDGDQNSYPEVRGVTQISCMTKYPGDPREALGPRWVAHFAHPIEIEWTGACSVPPGEWPVLFLQVCTYDSWDRPTTEGYGWLHFGGNCPGTAVHYVQTWRPLWSFLDHQRAFFLGGTPELEDISYPYVPAGFQGTILNKYGFQSETSGVVKVRLTSLLQMGNDLAHVQRPVGNRTGTKSPKRQDLSLAVVVERARMRLQEARGGPLQVRKGVLHGPPEILQHPQDTVATEGDVVEFKIRAVGVEPLRYQWCKDGRQLQQATADSPILILVNLQPVDAGAYHCQVSNKDGTTDTSSARMTIKRVSRFQRATSGMEDLAQGQLMSSIARRHSSLMGPNLRASLQKTEGHHEEATVGPSRQGDPGALRGNDTWQAAPSTHDSHRTGLAASNSGNARESGPLTTNPLYQDQPHERDPVMHSQASSQPGQIGPGGEQEEGPWEQAPLAQQSPNRSRPRQRMTANRAGPDEGAAGGQGS